MFFPLVILLSDLFPPEFEESFTEFIEKTYISIINSVAN